MHGGAYFRNFTVFTFSLLNINWTLSLTSTVLCLTFNILLPTEVFHEPVFWREIMPPAFQV